jgi:hypothetical protein
MNRLSRYKDSEKRSWDLYQEPIHSCICGEEAK